MKTYQDIFSDRRRAKLIPFFVLGDPNPEISLRLMQAAVEAGADALELGIPFSDPVADGPTIQKADLRALAHGVTCRSALEIVRQLRQRCDVPIGLLMYYNPICRYGAEAFYHDAAAAGVNSVLVADLCVDDAEEVESYVKANGLDTVYMVSPNTAEQRRRRIVEKCTGLIYTVAVLGVTGARTELGSAVKPLIKSLKAMTDTPVCVGFGVSQPEHCRELAAAGADGVFVGSAVVKIIEDSLDEPDHGEARLRAFISSLSAAL